MNLLSDEEIRQFIVDGALVLKPDVDPEIHERIDKSVRFALEREFQMGNNIVSRVPQTWKVLRSSRIHGALVSLLGPNYYVHPHRAVHTNLPVDKEDRELQYAADHNGPKMGRGSRAGSGWHQDAQSPLSRPRYHTPKFLIGFYFPHDTPELMGPTRYQAGSYLFSEPVPPTGVILSDFVPAGSFVLLHFDMVHAAWPNRTDLGRYMIKFVFSRTEHPRAPTWRNEAVNWQAPVERNAEVELNATWKYLWNWIRGGFSLEVNGNSANLGQLNSLNQEQRLETVYSVHPQHDKVELAERIRALAGSEAHLRNLAKDREGNPIARDHVLSQDRRWNERAIVMDDAAYALAAIGPPALETLQELLQVDDPWVLINAVFAVGELGPAAAAAVPRLVELLSHSEQQVVRSVLDALGNIGMGIDAALPAIERLLTVSTPSWQEPQVMRGWTGEDQVRLNAAFALLAAINYDNDLDAIEHVLSLCLDDPNGYVPAVAVEALTRLGTSTSHATAIQYLQDRRWDDTLLGGIKPF